MADVKQSVAIYGCFQATINVTGKCKGITIDSCEQVKVLLDTAISAIELVNCKRMQIQIRETAPTVAIDKTDGCLVYLSKDSLETSFTTAKSSEMNVCFPDPKVGIEILGVFVRYPCRSAAAAAARPYAPSATAAALPRPMPAISWPHLPVTVPRVDTPVVALF